MGSDPRQPDGRQRTQTLFLLTVIIGLLLAIGIVVAVQRLV
jgi:hypothetical protein